MHRTIFDTPVVNTVLRALSLAFLRATRGPPVACREPLVVPVEVLEREWTGQAWLFWRDFEGLGPTVLESPARGPRVARLQGLLGRVGHYQGPGHGLFDRDTMDAVLAFQRSRYIVADGVVGRLTRVVLYAAAGGYPRPTLAAAGAAS